MRFCANVSILFNEVPLLERFDRAARARFSAVEFWWPRDERLEEVEAAIRDAGVAVALFNFDAGDLSAGERGLLSDPARAAGFRENVPVALELARRLACPRLNALVGLEQEGRREEQLELAAENVAWAADQAAPHGIEVMIEAVNTWDNGPYLVPTTRAAAAFQDTVGRPNVKIQWDAYHMQRMEGNLVATLREHFDRITHIQVADSPGRNEPGTGEINFSYVLEQIEALGYGGWISLEYKPTTSTEESLSWLPADRRRQISASELRL